MADRVLLGNAYRIRVTFRDDARVLVDVATCSLTITLPDGSTTEKVLADLTHESTGVYHLDYLPGATGRFVWLAVSTGPNAAVEGWFLVESGAAALLYLDAGDLRGILAGSENLSGTAAKLSDEDLCRAIEQAQAEVDGRLAVRYPTPLATPPQLVIDITADIAAYIATLTYRRGEALQSGEPILLRYQRAQSLLAQIAADSLGLPVDTAPSGPGGTPAVANPIDGDLWTPDDFALVQQPVGYDLRWPW